MKRYILTGTPGAGKTSILRQLQEFFFIRNIGFCEPTAARRMSFQESLAFEQIHERSYRQFGYDLIDVPAGEVADRVAMIADVISQLT
ncbi:hypothetical protein ACFZDJ_51895 [Streptomyces sp. NPDC007896]|uniref:hypothetical protein n=1 Tax=Streptomyces sp. NPDC007896 TaxID=3364784 RepID=UPI0036E835A3